MISFSLFANIQGAFVGISPGEKAPPNRILFPKQIHSDEILVLESKEQWNFLNGSEADAVITSVSGVVVGVKTADCVPILLAHPQGVVAAVHAGWRGSAKQILRKTLNLMQQKWNLNLAEVQIAVGPSICGDCYEVGEEVAQVFQDYPQVVKSYGQKFLLDLWEVNLQQALGLGILKQNIRIEKKCTYTSKQFYSYRRMQKESMATEGRNVAWVSLR